MSLNRPKNETKEMFDSISGQYDLINNLLTFGLHNKWKSEIVKIAKKKNPRKILDMATGTADIAIMLSNIKNCEIIGLDISSKMIEIGKRKINSLNLYKKISLDIGDAENIKYADDTFDIVTVGYGVRNFENLNKGLNEIYRVLKKNGTLIILETSLPKNIFINFIYSIYVIIYVQLIGKLFSKNFKAYSYLKSSAKIFPFGEKFKKILLDSSFVDVQFKEKFFGASTIYIAQK